MDHNKLNAPRTLPSPVGRSRGTDEQITAVRDLLVKLGLGAAAVSSLRDVDMIDIILTAREGAS